MKLQPIGDRLLVCFDKKEEKSAGGLLLASSAQEKPSFCRIVSTGPGVTNADLKPGTKIIIKGYAGTDIKVDKMEVSIINEGDIIAILED